MNTNFTETNINNFIVHRVGNKTAEENCFLSQNRIAVNQEVKELLTHYFVSSFKSSEYFNFYHDIDINMNEVFACATTIFANPETLLEQSVNLAKHLYEQSVHPKIKGGEFYVVYFKDCMIDGETVDAVGLFKSENKDTFLKVYPAGDGFEIESEKGININKLDKNFHIYARWENFTVAVHRAVDSCKTQNINVDDHFREVTKMVELGSGSKREVTDFMLTRYACYLIAQNGDPKKEEIAFAQSYFAIQTRKTELIEERINLLSRLETREKLRSSEKQLSQNIYKRGVDDKEFGRIRSKGDTALFGGDTTEEMKKRLGIKSNRPLADFLPTCAANEEKSIEKTIGKLPKKS